MSKVSKHADLPIGSEFDKLTTTSLPYPLKKYGRWTQWFVKVQCSCGSPEKEALVSALRSFKTKSCGCHSKEIFRRLCFTKGFRTGLKHE